MAGKKTRDRPEEMTHKHLVVAFLLTLLIVHRLILFSVMIN